MALVIKHYIHVAFLLLYSVVSKTAHQQAYRSGRSPESKRQRNKLSLIIHNNLGPDETVEKGLHFLHRILCADGQSVLSIDNNLQ